MALAVAGEACAGAAGAAARARVAAEHVRNACQRDRERDRRLSRIQLTSETGPKPHEALAPFFASAARRHTARSTKHRGVYHHVLEMANAGERGGRSSAQLRDCDQLEDLQQRKVAAKAKHNLAQALHATAHRKATDARTDRLRLQRAQSCARRTALEQEHREAARLLLEQSQRRAAAPLQRKSSGIVFLDTAQSPPPPPQPPRPFVVGARMEEAVRWSRGPQASPPPAAPPTRAHAHAPPQGLQAEQLLMR